MTLNMLLPTMESDMHSLFGYRGVDAYRIATVA